MVPSEKTSSIGFEVTSALKGMTCGSQLSAVLIRQAMADLSHLAFYSEDDVKDGFVVRYPKAYPIYEDGYQEHMATIKGWLSKFVNLYCIGRYGQFRYNNMDHAMMTGILAGPTHAGKAGAPTVSQRRGGIFRGGKRKRKLPFTWRLFFGQARLFCR